MFNIPKNNWNLSTDDIKILKSIYNQVKNDNICPSKDNVLRFLSVDFSKVKVVIVGQNPYPQLCIENNKERPVATGRSFEVYTHKAWTDNIKQTSLRNILKAVYYNSTGNLVPLSIVKEKIITGEFIIKNPSDWFDSLEQQGVLWLNTSLTTKANNPGAHIALWEPFLDAILNKLENNGVTWFLWGNEAYNRVVRRIGATRVITAVHPRIAKFVEENPFQYVKDINWLG